MGENVALIEKDAAMYGGTCINVGCIPSKKLINAAAKAPIGDFAIKQDYYKKSVLAKNDLIKALRQKNYEMLVNAGVFVINGEASFIDKNQISVRYANGEHEVISANKIFINTGSTPILPNIKGLENNTKAYLSENILSLETLPKRLSIIGGGYIGLEFASMFAEFGSKVTIIQDNDVFLPREDSNVAEEILTILKNKGVELIKGANVLELKGGNIVYHQLDTSYELEGDAILVATGRKANTATLNCKAAGIDLDSRGTIVVDKHMRTSVPKIWAMGDVCERQLFTYISLDDARIVYADIYGDSGRDSNSRGSFAYSVFINPPFARVGLSENEAKQQKLNYRVVKLPAMAIPKAKILGETQGFMKALIDTDTGLILGAHFLCADAHEMINFMKLAIDQRLDYKVVRDFIFTHPSMSEALNDLFSL